MKFELPIPVNLANARLHWRAKQRAKKAYYAEADTLQLTGLGGVIGAPMDPYTDVHLTLFVHNRMDADNLAARCKWVLDWLHTRGYTVDDRYIEFRVSQRIDRKHKRVEVELS